MKKVITIALMALLVVGFCFATGSKETAAETPKTGTTTYKESIVYGTANACPSLDYFKVMTGSSNMVFLAAKERLVHYNPDSQVFEPILATSWTQNDTEIVFKLRENVKWSNGEDFTADDVVYTFKHLMESDGMYAEAIASIEALDAHTVKMVLSKYDADWFDTLAGPKSSISNKKAMEESNDTTVTTGPWIIKDFAADDYVAMERNENYWGELPKTKKLTFKTITENSARLVALQSGDIDVCQGPSNVDLDLIEEDKNLKLELGDSSKTIYLCFNLEDPLMADENFRKAVYYAIDRQEIVDIALDGYGLIGASTWGPSTLGFDSSIKAPEQNIELAKQYFKKACPSGSCNVELAVRNTAEWERAGEVVQEQLRKIGINVTINVMQSAAFTEYSGSGKHQLAVSGCAWPTAPGTWAKKMYYDKGSANRAHLYDPVVKELVQKGDSGKDTNERIANYQKVQALNEEHVWYITMFYDGTKTAMNAKLEGGRFDLPEKEVAYICIPE